MLTRLFAVAIVVSAGLFGGACAGPYAGPAERLPPVKAKKVKPKSDLADAGPDTCKTNFKGDPVKVPPRQKRNEADSFAQDADNLLSGIDTAEGPQKKAMAKDAINKAKDALAVDPYSPRAHLVMAAAYAWVGKKKCSLAMLERLKELKIIPEEQNEAIKMADKVGSERAFTPFKADAEKAVSD